jgi:hypothetical protein
MDRQVNNNNTTMKLMVFNIFKNIIIEQNKVLLKVIADKYDLDYDELLKKYITQDHYLPVITSSKD